MSRKKQSPSRSKPIAKTPTGIAGLDEITKGGLPSGRTTLIAGGAGSGKTIMAMEFLLRGIQQYNETAVCMTFEETGDELASNLASLGYDIPALVRSNKLLIDHVHVERREIEETGEYDLEGLFIRLGEAIDRVKAKRVVLDTIEVLFSGLENMAIVRSELGRLFRWLKQKGVTSIVTSETGDGSITRHGLEEYVADCVILLDHRVTEQISTRRIRVVKYRGTTHATNEFPFLLDSKGISVLPITSLGLDHEASTERISTGVPGLDQMLSGRGFYRGSSVLVSGTAGTGKSSLAAQFAAAACARGERTTYFAFEESPSQIMRNMSSIGLDLEHWIRKGLLNIHAARPTSRGLESHLATMHRCLEETKPQVVVIDPITNLISVGERFAVKSMLTRMIDHLKKEHITGLFTNLTNASDNALETNSEISSLMDSWILVREIHRAFERRRVIYVLKSRGMEHSSEMRELRISSKGLEVVQLRSKEATLLNQPQGRNNEVRQAKSAAR